MTRTPVLLGLIMGLLAACSTEPAGGRGPFDPTPPPRVAAAPTVVAVPQSQPRPAPEGQVAAPQQQLANPTIAAPQPQPSNALGAPLSATQTLPPANSAPLGDTALVADVEAALNGVPQPAPVGTGIDPNAQSINLALTSQEQQKIEREAAARQLAEARAQLVIVQPEAVPDQDLNANVVKFARETTHAVGTRKYARDLFRSRTQSAAVCARFASVDEAQRQFLSTGGPDQDRYNLDPDGDGFACKFSPDVYRQMKF